MEIKDLTDKEIQDIIDLSVICKGMKNRCYNKNAPGYADYGGRGIKVCAEWLQSPVAFIRDMWPRPSRLYSIDRKDNDRNYEKSNCQWATDKDQARNQRTTRFVMFNGQKRCLAELCEEYAVDKDVVRNRIDNLGWSVEQALGLKPWINPLTTALTYKGETLAFKDMAKKYGLTVVCLHKRLEAGMTLGGALTKPLEPRGGNASKAMVELGGVKGTIKSFAVKHHKDPFKIYQRIQKLGWTLRQALDLDDPPQRTAWNKKAA